MQATAALLALCFDDLGALAAPGLLDQGLEQNLAEFSSTALAEFLVDRFDGLGRPNLHFEVEAIVTECGGDPLALLRSASDRLDSTPTSAWRDHFPLDIFTEIPAASRKVPFEIADAHLHSGASVPLPLFFSVLASATEPIAHGELAERQLRSRDGQGWHLQTMLVATRWALRLLRYLADGRRLDDYTAHEERGLHHLILDRVADGTYWALVAELATSAPLPEDEISTLLRRRFPYNGLCSLGEVFWASAARTDLDPVARDTFLRGLIRACVAIAGVVRARRGEGLSRFADRFHVMGIARDAAVGEMKAKLTRQTLSRVASCPKVIGAEFRKTITATERDTFKSELRDALRQHHRGFAGFVEENGRSMALTMPVGFPRRPASGQGGEWTDLDQLRQGLAGFHALRLLLAADPSLAGSISTIDVAGDEYGSANWPFVTLAELLRRQGLELDYVIHAGESFYSPLNGVRRIGELFLADRAPTRIGHALALSATATAEICEGDTLPPIRFGDAICDLCWMVGAGVGNTEQAQLLLYELLVSPAGRSYEPQLWIDAYPLLFSVDALFEHRILSKHASLPFVTDEETLRVCARHADPLGRVLATLATGYADPDDDAMIDVAGLLPPELARRLFELSAASAESAREHVVGLLGGEGERSPTLIESCPTSNIRLANLAGLDSHPMWDWKQDGLGVVIGSDDPLIFGATIVDEFRDMLALKSEPLVAEIAATTVSVCSGGRRRDLSELESVAAFTGP